MYVLIFKISPLMLLHKTYIFIYTEKKVSLNQRNISLIYGQRKNFFELKKVFLIQTDFL